MATVLVCVTSVVMSATDTSKPYTHLVAAVTGSADLVELFIYALILYKTRSRVLGDMSIEGLISIFDTFDRL